MRSLLLSLYLLFFPLMSIAQSNNSCSCCTETHAQFDFWIGSWEVTNPDGSAAGKNTLIKLQDNCVLQENWISATPGYTGTSNSFYNLATKQWEQIWVDNRGQSLHLKGNRIGNQMILRTDDAKNSEGTTYFHQVTWTDNKDGTVRQYWETITQDGNVTVAFDGLYKKVQE